MELLGWIILGCFLCSSTGWYGYHFYRRARTARRLGVLRRRFAALPAPPHDGLPHGPVIAHGHCLARQQMRAPLSGKKVIGYHIEVLAAGTQRSEQSVLDETVVIDFEIATSEGQYRVAGACCALHLEQRTHSDYRSLEDLGVRVRRLLGRHGFRARHRRGEPSRYFSCTEQALTDGMEVYVYGMWRAVADARASETTYRETGWRSEIGAPAEGPLLITSAPLEKLPWSVGPLAEVPSALTKLA